MLPSGIRTHNLSRRAAANPRLRPRGYWDRHFMYARKIKKKKRNWLQKRSLLIFSSVSIFCSLCSETDAMGYSVSFLVQLNWMFCIIWSRALFRIIVPPPWHHHLPALKGTRMSTSFGITLSTTIAIPVFRSFQLLHQITAQKLGSVKHRI